MLDDWYRCDIDWWLKIDWGLIGLLDNFNKLFDWWLILYGLCYVLDFFVNKLKKCDCRWIIRNFEIV